MGTRSKALAVITNAVPTAAQARNIRKPGKAVGCGTCASASGAVARGACRRDLPKRSEAATGSSAASASRVRPHPPQRRRPEQGQRQRHRRPAMPARAWRPSARADELHADRARRPHDPGARRWCRSRSPRRSSPHRAASPAASHQVARHRRPADQGRPGKDDAEPCLRPPRDPLHERIGRDRRKAGERHQLRRAAVQPHQHDQSDRDRESTRNAHASLQ